MSTIPKRLFMLTVSLPLTVLWLSILLISAPLVVLLRALVFHVKLPLAISQSGGLRNYLDTLKLFRIGI